jgi:hypothetical protein
MWCELWLPEPMSTRVHMLQHVAGSLPCPDPGKRIADLVDACAQPELQWQDANFLPSACAADPHVLLFAVSRSTTQLVEMRTASACRRRKQRCQPDSACAARMPPAAWSWSGAKPLARKARGLSALQRVGCDPRLGCVTRLCSCCNSVDIHAPLLTPLPGAEVVQLSSCRHSD